jgi:hypothetical protein
MLWGEDGDGRTRWPWIECTAARAGDLISKSAVLKILGIDFNAGAGMFSLVAFIELVPRAKLTSNESSWGNHEP